MSTPPACLSPPIGADLSSSWFANSKQVPTRLTTALSERKEAWIIITQPATQITWNPQVWRCQYMHAPQRDSQVCWIVLVSDSENMSNDSAFADEWTPVCRCSGLCLSKNAISKTESLIFWFLPLFTNCHWSHKGDLSHTTWRSRAYIKWSATSVLEKIQLTCRNTRYVRFIFSVPYYDNKW